MKPILLIHQHPEIEKIQKEIEHKISFLNKQKRDIIEKEQSYFDEFWTKIHAYLETNSILKNPHKTRLEFRDGVIYERSTEEKRGLGDFIANLFQH